jgi:hypothetical protein
VIGKIYDLRNGELQNLYNISNNKKIILWIKYVVMIMYLVMKMQDVMIFQEIFTLYLPIALAMLAVSTFNQD